MTQESTVGSGIFPKSLCVEALLAQGATGIGRPFKVWARRRGGREVRFQEWGGERRGVRAVRRSLPWPPSLTHFWPQAENQLPFTKRPAMMVRLTLVQRAGDRTILSRDDTCPPLY